MKKKSIVDFRKLDGPAIEKKATNLRSEMAMLRLKKATEDNKNTNIISEKKQQLAVLLTIKREKEIIEITN